MSLSYEEIKDYNWKEELLRSTVVMILVNNGGDISNSRIASTLRCICNKLEGTWNVDATIKRAYKEEGADKKVRDTDFVDKVKKRAADDPTRFIRAIARDLGFNETAMRNYVSEDLRCRIYKMHKSKNKRLMMPTKYQLSQTPKEVLVA
ncbi:Uncharacterized protein FKW44_019270, partial [Caligus rogercresseyi]